MLTRLFIFFVLNFAALGIGGLFTGKGVPSEWYQSLMKAPWTPPGWVFGAAWTFIMIAFSFFMAFLWDKSTNKSNVILLYSIQWILNVAWNPTFFYAHQVLLGFVLISLLTVLVAFFLFRFMPVLRWKSLFILPYFVWLLIASSLNLYVYLYN
jgi:tryptophan-rich sensory protein